MYKRQTTFSAVYALTQADVDAGMVENQATVGAKDPSGGDVTDVSDDPGTLEDGDSTDIEFPTNPSIDLEKTGVFNDTNSDGIAQVGETITYTFTVTNDGDVTLTDVEITDPLVAVLGIIASMAPGDIDSTTFSAVYTLTQADVDAGIVENQATVTGESPSGDDVTAESDDPSTSNDDGDSTQTPLPPFQGMIELVKVGVFHDTNADGFVQAGEIIEYTFTVTNVSNVTISNIAISDPLVPVAGTIASLAPGEVDTCLLYTSPSPRD